MSRVFTNDGWPAEEVSTRNCANAKGYPTSNAVVCLPKAELLGTYNGVVSRPQLKPECVGCPQLDNKWQVN